MSWFSRVNPWQQPQDDPPHVAGHPESAGLHDRYEQGEDWQQNLHKSAAYQALNIPEKMGIKVDNRRTGVSPMALAIGSVALLGGGTLFATALGAALWFVTKKDSPTTTAPPTPVEYSDENTQYEIELPNADR